MAPRLQNSFNSRWLPAFLWAGLTASGCASRMVPKVYPATSASSTQAEEAPVADVTQTLRSDPPLPGQEDCKKWPGLCTEQPSAPDSQPSGPTHDHHGQHHEK